MLKTFNSFKAKQEEPVQQKRDGAESSSLRAAAAVSGAPDVWKWPSCDRWDVQKCQEEQQQQSFQTFNGSIARPWSMRKKTLIFPPWCCFLNLDFFLSFPLTCYSKNAAIVASWQNKGANPWLIILWFICMKISPKMHKHSLSHTHTDFIIPSIYANMHIYRPGGQRWKVWRLFKKAPVRRAVTERGLATQRLPSRKKKMDKHACVFPSHVFKCRRNSGQHDRKVYVIII